MFTGGLDQVLTEKPLWRNQRLGLLANQASVTRNGRYAWDALVAAGFNLRCVFSPQHGLWAEEQANMIESDHTRLAHLNLPVFSLYGETRTPTDEMLEGIDRLLVDLQDVGTRVYTFPWTLWHCLGACAERGIPVTVLDRPNPIGRAVEGPRLEPDFTSFVGEGPIPMRHGRTLGELGRWMVRRRKLDLEYAVVPVLGWEDDTLLAVSWPVSHWVPPSPNIPTPWTTLPYAGMVLLEGTNVSEGRGTTRPFEVAGAPYVDADELAWRLEALDLPAVTFQPVRFRPTFDKWAGECCHGVRLNVEDPLRFRPYKTAVAIIGTIAERWPDEFAWKRPPYEYETEHWPIDILSGSSRLRTSIDARDRPLGELVEELSRTDENGWLEALSSV